LVVGISLWTPKFLGHITAARQPTPSDGEPELRSHAENAHRSQSAIGAITALLEKWYKNGALDFRSHGELRRELRSWLNADPAGCLNWLDARGLSSLLESDTLNAWAEQLTSDSPRAGFQIATEILNPFRRDDIYSVIFDSLISHSPTAALSLLELLPYDQKYKRSSKLASAWAAKDPQAAFEGFLTKGALGVGFLTHIVAEWAKVNPDAEFVYLTRLSDATLVGQAGRDTTKNDLWYGFFDELVRKSPEKTLAFLRSMPTVPTSISHFCIDATGRLMIQNSDRAEEFLAALPNDIARQTALARAAIWSSLENSQAFLSKIESGTVKIEVVKAIARDRTFQGSTDKVLDWTQSIEDPLARNAAVGSAAEFSFLKNPANAVETAAQLSTATQKNFSRAVLERLFEQSKTTQPDELAEKLKWVQALSSEAKAWLTSNLDESRPEQKSLAQLLK
jgi:hypothetical protein